MERAVEVSATELAETYLITPRMFFDDRGYFVECFNKVDFASAELPTHFVQDNHSRSKKGVLRGLHYQVDQPQGKLVSAIRGTIFDVAVDVRRGSPTFGKWVGVLLDDVKRQSFWIPPGFAHGFCAMTDEVDVLYKCTEYYSPRGERGIAWNDSTLSIKWPITNPLVSDKDRTYSRLSQDSADLPAYTRQA
jgi:dTDP-4-dehydrorhamnose 3,5-epimerase